MTQVLVINDISRNPLVSRSLEVNGQGISISVVCSPTLRLGPIQIFKTVNVIQGILTSHNVPLSSYPSRGLVNQPWKNFLFQESHIQSPGENSFLSLPSMAHGTGLGCGRQIANNRYHYLRPRGRSGRSHHKRALGSVTPVHLLRFSYGRTFSV